MRINILLVAMLLVCGCASKTARDEAAPVITKYGLITAKQEATQEGAKDSRVNTSVYGSVSSGGGVSIGIGVLLSSFLSGNSDQPPIRYEVDLIEGDAMTIFHDSRDFAVGDCVLITVHPNEEKNPPTMQRSPGNC